LLDGLKTFQQELKLKDEDVARIEQPLREPVEATYQSKLKQQEQEKQRLAQAAAEQQAERERLQREQRQAKEQERQRQAALLKQQEAAERQRQQELEQQRLIERQREEEQKRRADQDELASEKRIDYTKLRGLLKANQWKEADHETYLRMLEAVGRQDGDWIRAKELEDFPCQDLKTIDCLWVNYSKGHFGFSVQKKIWQDCGSPKSSGNDWDRFCVKVGW